MKNTSIYSERTTARKWLTVILTSIFFCCNTQAQESGKKQEQQIGNRPKMIVNIVIDGLRSDYIAVLSDDLSDGGFRRIIGNGSYIRSLRFPYLNVGRAADYATIATGTLPKYHGITADTYWDRNTRKAISCLHDEKYTGNGVNAKISTKALKSSTIADELRLNTRSKGKIVSIGIDAEETAIMA